MQKQTNLVSVLTLGLLSVQIVLLLVLVNRVNDLYGAFLNDPTISASPGLIAEMRVENVSPDDDPSTGPDTSPVTIIEFSDFDCQYCRSVRETLAQVQSAYSNQVRIVYRDFPRTGPVESSAFVAAMAAECADEQHNFWAMHDILFDNPFSRGRENMRDLAVVLGLNVDQFQDCMESGEQADEVAKDFADGVSYGVLSTPTFFINGRTLVGAQPLSAFQRLIDIALSENN